MSSNQRMNQATHSRRNPEVTGRVCSAVAEQPGHQDAKVELVAASRLRRKAPAPVSVNPVAQRPLVDPDFLLRGPALRLSPGGLGTRHDNRVVATE